MDRLQPCCQVSVKYFIQSNELSATLSILYQPKFIELCWGQFCKRFKYSVPSLRSKFFDKNTFLNEFSLLLSVSNDSDTVSENDQENEAKQNI